MISEVYPSGHIYPLSERSSFQKISICANYFDCESRKMKSREEIRQLAREAQARLDQRRDAKQQLQEKKLRRLADRLEGLLNYPVVDIEPKPQDFSLLPEDIPRLQGQREQNKEKISVRLTGITILLTSLS